jgi:hypothetical protein
MQSRTAYIQNSNIVLQQKFAFINFFMSLSITIHYTVIMLLKIDIKFFPCLSSLFASITSGAYSHLWRVELGHVSFRASVAL